MHSKKDGSHLLLRFDFVLFTTETDNYTECSVFGLRARDRRQMRVCCAVQSGRDGVFIPKRYRTFFETRFLLACPKPRGHIVLVPSDRELVFWVPLAAGVNH